GSQHDDGGESEGDAHRPSLRHAGRRNRGLSRGPEGPPSSISERRFTRRRDRGVWGDRRVPPVQSASADSFGASESSGTYSSYAPSVSPLTRPSSRIGKARRCSEARAVSMTT